MHMSFPDREVISGKRLYSAWRSPATLSDRTRRLLRYLLADQVKGNASPPSNSGTNQGSIENKRWRTVGEMYINIGFPSCWWKTGAMTLKKSFINKWLFAGLNYMGETKSLQIKDFTYLVVLPEPFVFPLTYVLSCSTATSVSFSTSRPKPQRVFSSA